jgi:hypothetical protein
VHFNTQVANLQHCRSGQQVLYRANRRIRAQRDAPPGI